jgi:hypothetical protein
MVNGTLSFSAFETLRCLACSKADELTRAIACQ